MLTLFETLGGVWLLTIAWGCWKTTLRDSIRDDLFDLRDEWREFWIATGNDMNSVMYKRVREYLNQYLRYTKSLRFVGLVYIVFKTDRRLVERLCSDQNNLFVTGDLEVDAEIRKIRHRATRSVQAYMCGTTLVLLLPLLVIALVSVLAQALKAPVIACRSAAGKLVDAMPCTRSKNIDLAVCVAT